MKQFQAGFRLVKISSRHKTVGATLGDCEISKSKPHKKYFQYFQEHEKYHQKQWVYLWTRTEYCWITTAIPTLSGIRNQGFRTWGSQWSNEIILALQCHHSFKCSLAHWHQMQGEGGGMVCGHVPPSPLLSSYLPPPIMWGKVCPLATPLVEKYKRNFVIKRKKPLNVYRVVSMQQFQLVFTTFTV